MAPATFAVALLRLVLASRALRPQQHLWQLQSAPAIAPPARKAKASKLEVKADVQPRGLMKSWLSHEQAGLPPCDDKLPVDGNRTLDSALNLSACTWRASGAQVILGAPLTFQGDLVLQGELQITGAKELHEPCITVLGNLTLVDARVSFLNCKEKVQASNLGGALFVQEDLSAFNSSIAFKYCRGTSGGGVYAKSFLLEQSKADFDSCTASSLYTGGGGAYIKETFRMNANSSASFRGCSAQNGRGGGVYAKSFLLKQSKADFDNCMASEVMGGGGGAYIVETFRMNANSAASFRDCSAEHGGGVYAKSFLLEQSKADFDNSMALGTGGGGGAHIVETFRMNFNSSASFRGCSAENGGGLRCKSFLLEQSKVDFDNCTATFSLGGSGRGGGAHIEETIRMNATTASFRGCSAEDGGGLLAKRFLLEQSKADFDNCTATFSHSGGGGRGGGAHIEETIRMNATSSASFRGCSAEDGGGLHVENFLQAAESTAEFDNCAARFGGGLYTSELSGNGSMRFERCEAEEGGGVHVQDGGNVRHNGSLSFEECNALKSGGGIFSNAKPGHFRKLLFKRCAAGAFAAAFTALGARDVHVKELSLLESGASNVKDIMVAGALTIDSAELRTSSTFGTYISAQSLVLAGVMDCTNTTTCVFYANTTRATGFRCPVGMGVVDHEALHDFGCLACEPGKTQILNGSNRSCSACPDGARECLAGRLKLEPGLMVEQTNVSHTLHCPSEAACPGGQLPQGTAMCEAGYEGRGCANCRKGYAMGDSSVLSCRACSDEPRVQAAQWAIFLSQRVVLFVLAATSALGAKRAGDLKQSSVYLNQLMAFATISTAIMAAVMETQTAKDMKSDTVHFLFNATMAVAETSSGQGSVGTASSQCLLSYLGYGKTLWGSHLLDVAVAAVLVALLSLAKDSRAALIAGLNCFLPSIAADFGKYLVCFRLEPDDGSGFQGLECPFLPAGSPIVGAAQVLGGLALCFGAALWTWLRLSKSTEDPLPSHVVFLTSKYKPEHALFETERLVRKILLTFIGAFLPIASSPALQMTGLGAVILTSLISYMAFNPYHTPEWNRIEIILLSTAMYMIVSVSGLLANEFHWGHSVRTQQAIIITTAAVAGVASISMSARVVTELFREHFQTARQEGK